MTACSAAVSPADYAAHTPRFESRADSLMRSWADLDVAELAASIKISVALARTMREMILSFPDKEHGARAIEAFTGVVFKALDCKTMSADERAKLSQHVRIVSSLYGWLRPDDFIKAYRLDFTTPLAPGRQRMAQYWQSEVTAALLDEIAAEGSREVLDLLPGDAARCIDWAEVKKVAAVCKADFRTADPPGTVRTPHANLLKTLRGELLRQIITEDITDFASLRALAGDPTPSDSIVITI